VQCVSLHADGMSEHRLALTQQAHANVTPVRPVADGFDESGLGNLMDQKRDARLGAVELAGESPLDGPVRTAGRDHEEEVIALLGEAESHERLAHDGLRLGEGPAQLGNELDVGQCVTRQPHPVGGHVENVHAEGIDCVGFSAPSARLHRGTRRP
jgi:hypothetical protein